MGLAHWQIPGIFKNPCKSIEGTSQLRRPQRQMGVMLTKTSWEIPTKLL